MGRVKNLLKNLKFLSENSLRDRERAIACAALERVGDLYYYDLKDSEDQYGKLNVLSSEETVDLLLAEPKSFCRFGDGEMRLVEGSSISFQEYDAELAECLAYIMANDIPNMYVGVNYEYFHSSKGLNEATRAFYLYDVPPLRKKLYDLCAKDRRYIAACFNQRYVMGALNDIDAYYSKIRQLFEGRKLLIISGQGILDSLEHDVFALADERVHITGPSMNAYAHKTEILNKVRTYSTEWVPCFVLGPASKAFVFELTREGYMAWDIGHLAEDYNAYMHDVDVDERFIVDFYAPK